jgi:hypothetical protein
MRRRPNIRKKGGFLHFSRRPDWISFYAWLIVDGCVIIPVARIDGWLNELERNGLDGHDKN